MKASKELYESVKGDIKVMGDYFKVNYNDLSIGDLWRLLSFVSRDRAYDDLHPGFASKVYKRLLPYDGRDYCFYYKEGLNDDHVTTMLKSIKKELTAGN
jgi:hypothetical protein